MTKSVEEALADDFDFPEVVRQLESLVDTTNLELNRRPNAPVRLFVWILGVECVIE